MESDETPNARWSKTQRELERLRCKRQALQAQQLDASSPNEGTSPHQPTKSALQAANSVAANRNARIKSDARKLLDTLQTSDSSVGYATDSVKLLFAKQALRVLSERKAAEEVQLQQQQRRSDTAGEQRLGADQLQRQQRNTRHGAEPAPEAHPHVTHHITHPRSSQQPYQHDTSHRHARYRAHEDDHGPQPHRDAPTRTSARRPVYEAPSSGEPNSWEGSSGSWSGDELPPPDKARSSHGAAHRSSVSASRSRRPRAEGSPERLVRGTVTAEALSALLAAMQSHGLNLTARPPRPLPDAMPPPATSIAVQTGDAGPGVVQHNSAIPHAQLPYVQQQQQPRYVLMSDGTLGVVQPIGAVPQLQTQVQPASPQPGASAAIGTPMGLSPASLAQPQPWVQQQALPSGMPPSPYAAAASPSAFTSPYAAYQASPVHAAQPHMPYSHLRAPPSTPYAFDPSTLVPLSPELPTPASTSEPAPAPSQLPPYTLPLPGSPAPYLHAPEAELHRYLYHMHHYQQLQPPYLHYGHPYPHFLPPYVGGPTPPPPTPTTAAASNGSLHTAHATCHADVRQHSPSQSVDGRGSGLQPSGSSGGYLGHLGHVAPSHSHSHSRSPSRASLHAEGSAGGAAGQGGGAAGSRRESLQGLDSPASFRDLPSRSPSPAPAAQLRRTASPTSPTTSAPMQTTGPHPQSSSASQHGTDGEVPASSRQLPLRPGAESASLTAGAGVSAAAVTDVSSGRASGPGGHDSGTRGSAGGTYAAAGGTEPRRSSLELVQDWGARRGSGGGAGGGFLRTAASEAAIDTSAGSRGLLASGLRIVTSAQSMPTTVEGEAPDTPTSRKPSFTGRGSQLPSLSALGLPPYGGADDPAGRGAANGQQHDGSQPQPPRAGDAADGRGQEGSTALALTSAILGSAQPAAAGAGAAGSGAPTSTAGAGLAVVQGLQQLGMGHLVAQRQPSAVVASIDATIPPTAATSHSPATSQGLRPSYGGAVPGSGAQAGVGAQAGGAAPSLASPTSRLAMTSSLEDQYSPRGRSRLKLVGNDDIPSPRTTGGGQASPTSSGGLFHGQHAQGLPSPGSRPQSLSQVQSQSGLPSPRHRLSVGQLGYPTDTAPWERRSDAPPSATDSRAVLREASGASLRAVEGSWGGAPAAASAAGPPLGHMSAASAFAGPAAAAAAPELLLPSLSPPTFGLGSLAVPLEEAGAGASEGALHRASMAGSGRSYAAPAAGVGPGPPGSATAQMDSTPSLARADSSFVRFGSMPRNPSSAPAAAAPAPALHIRTGGEPSYGAQAPSPRQSQPGILGGPSFRNSSGPSSGTASPHGMAGLPAAGMGGGGGSGSGVGSSGPPPLGAKAASSRTLGDGPSGFLGGLFASTRGSRSARMPTASGTTSSARTSGTGGGRASSIATRAMSKSGEFESDDEDEDDFGGHLGALGLGSSGGFRGAAGGGSERTTPTLQPAGARSARGSAVGGDDGEFEF